jgi:4'-phosphopantetheinyl transferase
MIDENSHQDLSWLPVNEQQKLSGFHRYQDKMIGVVGKLLLRHGLQELGFSPKLVLNLQYTEQNKPYLDIPWNFNITHCNDFVAIVFAERTFVGLDVEKIEPIQTEDFKSCFTELEWTDILDAEDLNTRFFYYWTRKEAILKGIGSGLMIHPSLFTVMHNQVIWNKSTWFLHQVETDKTHMCFLATEDTEPELSIIEINDPFR